jgi:cyclase
VAERLDIPFTVGGGISSVEDVDVLLHNGADKVSVNSAAVRDPGLIDRLASKFGSQCIVVALDARRIEHEWKIHLMGGKVPTRVGLFPWAREAEQRGAGELLFTSMEHDGTKGGFANEALKQLSEVVNIPIIASGGAGEMVHFEEAFTKGGADAALAASVFHFGEIPIPKLKTYLKGREIPVRI